MGFVYTNPNPADQQIVGDCVVRAVAIALDVDWDEAYILLLLEGYKQKDMPSSDRVWISLLQSSGFRLHSMPACVNNSCWTVGQFSEDKSFRKGTFTIGTGGHAVTVIDGDIYDTWDSRNEPVIFYLSKEE